jgi:tellurite methyltransferase
VLDIGCGDGRHAIYFAQGDCVVTAFDSSDAAIRKLRHRAAAAGVTIEASVADMRTYEFGQDFDVIIAHGVLQLVERPVWQGLIRRMKRHTSPGGWNAMTVGTDAIPPTPDMAPFSPGVFKDGELATYYTDWTTPISVSYVTDCQHGDTTHQHSGNRVFARNASAAS